VTVRAFITEVATVLVLSRKKNESFLVGDNVIVTVLKIEGDKIKLGIDAPADVEVDRYEVRRAKERNNNKESLNG
jgi:carbon storage regulator